MNQNLESHHLALLLSLSLYDKAHPRWAGTLVGRTPWWAGSIFSLCLYIYVEGDHLVSFPLKWEVALYIFPITKEILKCKSYILKKTHKYIKETIHL